MRTGFSTGLSRWMPALVRVVFAAVLLWSAGASASPSAHAVHAGHHPAAQGRTAPTTSVLVAALLSAPPAQTPCHHEGGRMLPPCCVGFGCVALHIGILADALPLALPGRAERRPASAPLLEGEGVPPDLPPPRLD